MIYKNKYLMGSLLTCLVATQLVASDEHDQKVSITLTAKANSDLGRMMQKVDEGIYQPSPGKTFEVLAQSYVPAEGEPSVIDLFNKYYIRGQYTDFYNSIWPLCQRGNPVAMNLMGTKLGQDDMPKKGRVYQHALHLLAMASKAGVASADNNLGMFLWYENKKDKALGHFEHGKNDPHDCSNLGDLLEDMGRPATEIVPVLARGAELGAVTAANSLASYYSIEGKDFDAGEALKWYLVSYHGPGSMDIFSGFEEMIQFMSSTRFSASDIDYARRASKKWVMQHPAIFMDGFDMVRLGAQIPGKPQSLKQARQRDASVQECFWNYYAQGDVTTFAAAIQPFLERGDANAMYMQAWLNMGLAGEPDYKKRRYLLEEAAAEHHPMAFLDLAIDLWMEAALELESHKKQTLLRRAYENLQEGYDRWYNSSHRQVIGDLVFLLGYFETKGIGMDEADPELGAEYISEAFKLSPLAAGYLGRKSKDPVQGLAYLYLAKPNFTQGDWFGGVQAWQERLAKTDQTAQVAAMKLADKLAFMYPVLKQTFYQRMAAGLNPEFSGL